MSVGVLDDLQSGIGHVAPLTVDQYHRMIAAGILDEDDPLELIDGMLVRRDRQDSKGGHMPQGKRHSGILARLGELLTLQCVPLGCHLRIQLPLPLPPIDEPEPDLCIVRGRSADFLNKYPDKSDVLAAIEVSDNSLTYDQKTKHRLYAASNLPLYMIVNLPQNTIEVYTRPIPNEQRFETKAIYRRGETFELNLGDTGSVSLVADDFI